jgi:hypothetical protein
MNARTFMPVENGGAGAGEKAVGNLLGGPGGRRNRVG